MLTAGVDLAAEARGTALALIQWDDRGAQLVDLQLGVTDAPIVELVRRADKLGIDCALGWPDEFVEFVSAHARCDADPATIDGGIDWRRTLAYRETDREVRRVTGRWPLSVSTDRLGLTAMRCAGLLARLADAGADVDRSGSGLVVEVYPGASLRTWGFVTAGYRANAEARAALVRSLADAAPWLDLAPFIPLLLRSTDAFDAVVAALATRGAALGLSTPLPAPLRDRARREGWIALPTGRLDDLLG